MKSADYGKMYEKLLKRNGVSSILIAWNSSTKKGQEKTGMEQFHEEG